jgi:hypothetical protein
VSAGVAFVAAVLCVAWVGQMGKRAVRKAQETAEWKQNAESVALQLRRLFDRKELLEHAVHALMTELNATRGYVFVLEQERFELRAALPEMLGEPVGFEPASGRPGKWPRTVRGAQSADVELERQRLKALDVEAGVAFWRGYRLAGFFLLGGRLTSDPFTGSQKLFSVEVAAEVGRMQDVLDGAQAMAVMQAASARVEAEKQLLATVRQRMAAPDTAEVPGVEFGVGVEYAVGGHAAFCDAVVLPGALGVVLAESAGAGAQEALDMVRLQTLLRSRLYVYGDDLREMLESVERAVVAGETGMPPMRLFIGRYDASARRLVYINADYLPPVLLSNRAEGSQTRRLTRTGRPLAGDGPADWIVGEVELRRRDLLLLFSPGLVECEGAEENSGENRVLGAVLGSEGQTAQAIAQRLLREAAEAAGGKKPTSERSVIVLRPASPQGGKSLL